MTELIIATDKHSKRRLPTWMQSNDTSKNEKLGTLDGLCSISGNQTEMEGAVSMTESMSSEANMVLAEKIKNSGNKQIFGKSHSKKNTMKPKNSDDSKDSTCNNTSGAKRKSKGEILERAKSLDTQHMKLKSAKSNSVKFLSHGRTEDAAELTVKDLINIAEEFLTTNKEIQKEQSAARKCESDFIFMSSSEAAIPPIGKLNREITSCQPLSKCTQTHSSKLNNLVQEQVEESATLSANKVGQSGDAAQDMLQLFLGPLLKKAPLKAPRQEMARELLTSTYESDSPVSSAVDVEEKAPLMKKKSSFKDKVAMFF